MPGREHRQRQSRQTQGRGGQGFALRAVQASELVGAGRGEHVALSADEFREHRVVQIQRGDQMWVVPGDGGRVFVGHDGGKGYES